MEEYTDRSSCVQPIGFTTSLWAPCQSGFCHLYVHNLLSSRLILPFTHKRRHPQIHSKHLLVKRNQTKRTYGDVIDACPLVHLPSFLCCHSFCWPPSFSPVRVTSSWDRCAARRSLFSHLRRCKRLSELHDWSGSSRIFTCSRTWPPVNTAAPVNFYICVSYMCQGCGRVYLLPPYRSVEWAQWFVGASGAFVGQILVNIMDLYILWSLE